LERNAQIDARSACAIIVGEPAHEAQQCDLAALRAIMTVIVGRAAANEIGNLEELRHAYPQGDEGERGA
jgi:hypothetical protein